ncbi:thiopurine S-methyltransferase [Thiorhodococcus mannitoliphagus]|uniref:Thiopurine S-methyltransferase n=1 Tax=Thiorhodococcus mannitoliphagus TaxID=329406 RepID=A0A6P1E181_9GAMM|nr:thiopurine S-methyltransferase [Thiorhodococcus mannitoliphagus]NEX22242.1 thiopurine S-methyltransferase [Thiorhodococcus mannitoliphagus]
MDPEFWLERWSRREIGWHLDDINSHLQEHWPTLGLPKASLVFVPLCGKTLDLLWLVSQGYQVVGVEISQLAVEELFAEHRLTPSITRAGRFQRYQVDELSVLCGDFFDLEPGDLGQVDAVFDRASLIALPPAMRARYAARMQSLFPQGMETLLITLSYDQAEMSGPPFSVHRSEVETLYRERYRIDPLASFDALPESAHFQRRGLTALREEVYRLKPLREAALTE